ncbi:ADP-ribosylglycohydrolase family protein [Microbispora sp. NEAU-D428]|uniref:ADP-ribosylglycohydrolase family protein n=1 Tax=Microbispora sitophila TaxID=2771537 RepID=UPI001865D01B|nr:ADP-ribosylglycohydrolase family protein [Microbispora sitophila]MBE3011711.1 ADP-ribosylglycohydrolase family protein [Microbispora sitophila]
MSGRERVAALRPRVLACLLGGAIGDALGNPVEFLSLRRIRETYGPDGLTGMVRHEVTDDTQMTLFTTEGLIRALLHGRGTVAAVHDAYLRWLDTQDHPGPPPAGDDPVRTGWLREQNWLYARRAPGATCLSGLRTGVRPSADADAPDRTGPVNPHSKGCGTVMRSAPFGFVSLRFEHAARCARITHGHPAAGDAAGALALIIGGLAHGEDLRHAVGRALGRLGCEGGETAAALRSALDLAAAGAPSAEQVERLGGGWVAEEALAIAVYCALAAPDPRTALLLAVNHSGDSDSTGAICGNILGAWHGAEALPAEWAAVVEGRGTITDIAGDFAEVLVTRRLPADRAVRYP